MSEMQKKEFQKAGERYLPIKNLSQLKRAIREGRHFRIIEHYVRPEYTGQLRQPRKVQTKEFYSVVADDPGHSLNSANNGNGSYVAYGKARDWRFDEDGACTLKNSAQGRPIWKIGIL